MLKTIDLCSGIGGIRLGFERAGFRNVMSVDNDKFACLTYKCNFGDDAFGDVRHIEEIPEYDILLSGFPCPSFSTAGNKKGFMDKTRGTIFFHIANIIDKTRPKAFLLENVRGLIGHKKGETFRVILDILGEELGYNVFWDVLNAKDFGVPQHRPRVFIVGFKDRSIDFNFPTRSDKVLYKNVGEVIEDEPVDLKYYLSEGFVEYMLNHKKRHSSKGNNFGYEILDLDGIANTLLATGGSGKEMNIIEDKRVNFPDGTMLKYKKTPLSQRKLRFLTPREWARLQGFHDSFMFPVSDTQAYKQIGNSVAIPVVESVAKHMAKLTAKHMA